MVHRTSYAYTRRVYNTWWWSAISFSLSLCLYRHDTGSCHNSIIFSCLHPSVRIILPSPLHLSSSGWIQIWTAYSHESFRKKTKAWCITTHREALHLLIGFTEELRTDGGVRQRGGGEGVKTTRLPARPAARPYDDEHYYMVILRTSG